MTQHWGFSNAFLSSKMQPIQVAEPDKNIWPAQELSHQPRMCRAIPLSEAKLTEHSYGWAQNEGLMWPRILTGRWFRKGCWNSLNGESVGLSHKSCPPALTGLWSGFLVFLLVFRYPLDFQVFSILGLGMLSIQRQQKSETIPGSPHHAIYAFLSVCLSLLFFYWKFRKKTWQIIICLMHM